MQEHGQVGYERMIVGTDPVGNGDIEDLVCAAAESAEEER